MTECKITGGHIVKAYLHLNRKIVWMDFKQIKAYWKTNDFKLIILTMSRQLHLAQANAIMS